MTTAFARNTPEVHIPFVITRRRSVPFAPTTASTRPDGAGGGGSGGEEGASDTGGVRGGGDPGREVELVGGRRDPRPRTAPNPQYRRGPPEAGFGRCAVAADDRSRRVRSRFVRGRTLFHPYPVLLLQRHPSEFRYDFRAASRAPGLPNAPARRGRPPGGGHEDLRNRRSRVHRLPSRRSPPRRRPPGRRPRRPLHRANREPRGVARPDRVRQGRPARQARGREGRRRMRGRLPPGGARGRRAQRREARGSHRRERRRDAERPDGVARREGAPRRLRLVVVGLRRHPRAAQDRDDAPLAPLALRGVEGGGRGLPVGLPGVLRPRDRRVPLLQRLRPPAVAEVALRRRGAALRRGARLGRGPDDLRRRPPDPRLHLRRRRRGRPRPRGERPARGGRPDEPRRRAADLDPRPRRRDRPRRRPRRRAPPRARARRRRARLPRRHPPRPEGARMESRDHPRRRASPASSKASVAPPWRPPPARSTQ